MYPVSATWQSIIVTPNHEFETKVSIGGVEYTQDKLMSVSVNWRMFSEDYPVVGACLSAEIDVTLLNPIYYILVCGLYLAACLIATALVLRTGEREERKEGCQTRRKTV